MKWQLAGIEKDKTYHILLLLFTQESRCLGYKNSPSTFKKLFTNPLNPKDMELLDINAQL